MKNFEKYERQYFLPPVCEYDWVKKDYIDKAPIWCSVDLREFPSLAVLLTGKLCDISF